MSLICSLCNEVPDSACISPVSGHIFERRLIEKYLAENGVDPINQEPLSIDQLIDVKVSNFIKPRAPQATSIPALLKSLQDEWDAVMLYSFTLRQQLQTARQELSHALYQHDAACRVIARLSKEVSAAREALSTLKPHINAPVNPSTASVTQSQVNSEVAKQISSSESQSAILEPIGLSEEIIQKLGEKASQLTQQRKRRSKTLPEYLADPDTIRNLSLKSSHAGLHSASLPGILSIDVGIRDQSLIVTGGVDKNAVVFNIMTEQNLAVLHGHNKRVTRALFHADDELILTASADQTVRIWSVKRNHCELTFNHHSQEVTGLDVHATGDFLLSSSSDSHWAFADMKTGRLLVRKAAVDKSGNGLALTCCQFHPDGILLGTGTQDGEIKIWDLKEAKNVANFPHCVAQSSSSRSQPVTSLAFSENGYYLATGAADGLVKLWDLRKLNNFKILNLNEISGNSGQQTVREVRFDQSGTYLAVAGGEEIRVFSCKQWDQLSVFSEHTAATTGVRFSTDARQILSCSMDRTVKVFAALS